MTSCREEGTIDSSSHQLIDNIYLRNMIDSISPDVVVFAGDNIYDSGSTGDVDDIEEFLTVLSSRRIRYSGFSS